MFERRFRCPGTLDRVGLGLQVVLLVHEWLKRHLVCPRDRGKLEAVSGRLECEQGHRYPIVEAIPVMLFDDGAAPHPALRASLAQVERLEAGETVDQVFQNYETVGREVDGFVQNEIPYTCGTLYFSVQNHLTRYPIPELRLSENSGERFLDVGCGWGRWTIAAEKKGYKAVGVDPSLESLLAAARVARQLGVEPLYVAADSLPALRR